MQWASIDALNTAKKTSLLMVEEFGRRRDYVYNRLTSITGNQMVQMQKAHFI